MQLEADIVAVALYLAPRRVAQADGRNYDLGHLFDSPGIQGGGVRPKPLGTSAGPELRLLVDEDPLETMKPA